MSKIFLLICSLPCAVFAQTNSATLSIVPWPRSITTNSETFELNASTVIYWSGECKAEVDLFTGWLSQATAKNYAARPFNTEQITNFIWFHCTNNSAHNQKDIDLSWLPVNTHAANRIIPAGGYKIFIKPNGIVIQANGPQGIFYATQTLRQLIDAEGKSQILSLPIILPNVIIDDEPQYAHRGLLLDCCRHFMSVDFVKQTIDLIAQYKMNVLHWHLTEDQGWRIQIDKYPLLTEVGAWRTEEDGSIYGGFYTKEQIREVVAYAATRHVTIIPEIEMPGHSVAAIAAYPQLSCTTEKISVENNWGVFKDIYCAGSEYTFEFLENVLSEVCELFPSPYIHIGGDEAPKYRWERCAKCQKRIANENLKDEHELQTYFIERIAAFLATKNKRVIGWDEILEGGIPADAIVQSWRGMDGGKKAALEGHQVIMSPTSHCYLDYPLQSTDLREVYSFRPVPDSLSMEQKLLIMGAECNMWTEHAPQNTVHSKIFPRLIALAEVLWTPEAKLDFPSFQHRLSANYNRLDKQGVQYGFETVPFTIATKASIPNAITVELSAASTDVLLTYSLAEDAKNGRIISEPATATHSTIVIDEPTMLLANASWRGKEFPTQLIRRFTPHKGLNKPTHLSYALNKYYPAGGTLALVDGALGSKNFRDGQWQGVNGQDMEVTVDLLQPTAITGLQSNWYQYGNAWIMPPSKVEYYISSDGDNWELMASVAPAEVVDGALETIENVSVKFEKKVAQYIKMVAHNPGPLPEWHDAAGEPSWLFCDELVIE